MMVGDILIIGVSVILVTIIAAVVAIGEISDYQRDKEDSNNPF